MASVEDFLRAPSEELLERCSRQQLVKIADHFEIDGSDKRMKENIKAIVRANLLDTGVIRPVFNVVGYGLDVLEWPSASEAGLTFEQRRGLLLLQTEREKLALERLRKEAEIKQFEVEERRLSLV